MTHTHLRVQLRQAVQQRREEIVGSLLHSVAAALRDKDAAEAALRRHQTVAHGGGAAQAETA